MGCGGGQEQKGVFINWEIAIPNKCLEVAHGLEIECHGMLDMFEEPCAVFLDFSSSSVLFTGILLEPAPNARVNIANLVCVRFEGEFPYTVWNTGDTAAPKHPLGEIEQKSDLIGTVVEFELGELAGTRKPAAVRIDAGKLLQGFLVFSDKADDLGQDLVGHLKQPAAGHRRPTLHDSI